MEVKNVQSLYDTIHLVHEIIILKAFLLSQYRQNRYVLQWKYRFVINNSIKTILNR